MPTDGNSRLHNALIDLFRASAVGAKQQTRPRNESNQLLGGEMKSPNPGWRWRCCSGKPLRSMFCPECGGKAPQNKSNAEMIADDLEAEAESWYRNADTSESKAESIKTEHDLSDLVNPDAEYSQTWGDVYRHRMNTAIGVRKRGDKASMYARTIRELLAEVESLRKST